MNITKIDTFGKSQTFPVSKLNDFEFVVKRIDSFGMKVPVRVYANETMVNDMMADRTIYQAVNISALPGVVRHVAVLPDGHEGYGFPVGGVAAMDLNEGVISPGGDEHDIRAKIIELVHDLFHTIPVGLGGKTQTKLNDSQFAEILVEGMKWTVRNGYGLNKDMEVCEENGHISGADISKTSDVAKKRGITQLGSLGSGNHFLEIQKVGKIYDENAAKLMGIYKEGQITVLIHCGSRGFGHQVCTDYLRVCEQSLKKFNIVLSDKQLACVPFNSSEGENYMKAMRCSQNFAWANRQMITYHIRKVFENVLNITEQQLEMDIVYDVSHNIAKIERHFASGSDDDEMKKDFLYKGYNSKDLSNKTKKDVLVHRKGATRAFPAGMKQIPFKYRDIGQPVIIPGSMGTASWLLLGGHKSMYLTFGSTAHGAGRTMSRQDAKREYTYEKVCEEMQTKGVYFKSLTRSGIVEEIPEAYKDVDLVAEISHRLGIATKVAKLIPLGVIKG
jgi:tRNA-splicing ligase RtcB (3'-phosphate/5'-hydroxy nucleic acid ligase)